MKNKKFYIIFYFYFYLFFEFLFLIFLNGISTASATH
jgi:hypothetical protein